MKSKHIIAAAFLLSCLVAVPLASGSSIKTWSTGEAIRASDLNTVLSHLHSNLGHGHGAVVVNADISASAAIAHSKLATPALVAKAWATATVACGGAVAGTPCTLAASSGVTSVTGNGVAGQYRLNLTTNPGDTSFGVVVTSHTGGNRCTVGTFATVAPHAIITCLNNASPEVANDTAFTVMVLDNT